MFREPGHFVADYCHGLWSAVLAVPLLFGGCVAQRQGQAAPQNQAERLLTRTERSELPPEQRTAQYLAVCETAENQPKQRPGSPISPSAEPVLMYDRASADLASSLPALLRKHPGSRSFAVRNSQTGEAFLLRLEFSRSEEYRPDFFQQILTAQRVKKKGLNVNVSHAGFRGPVVGVHHTFPVGTPPPRFEPLQGFRIPMTAIVEFDKASKPTTARVRLLDPDKVESTTLAGKPRGLAADYSATYGSYRSINETWIGFLNMARGQHMRGSSGLLFADPYNSKKIPVLLVHGLLATSYTWRNVVNSLTADPRIRRHYQFWVFSYSTGNPIAYSAYLLRTDLAGAQQAFRFKQLILIGHSMGGILARLQVTNSGRKTWDEAFGEQANQLYAELPETSLIKRALLFRANPAIKRVIFLSTPHRGASLASGGIGALGIRLIRLPSRIVTAIPQSLLAALTPDRKARKYRLPTSISGLSPKSPLLIAMNRLPIEAPHNSIIGDRGRGDTPNSSDGVVPYWSSHLESAQSEIIVPTDHGSMKSPLAVAEIRRILLEEIGQNQMIHVPVEPRYGRTEERNKRAELRMKASSEPTWISAAIIGASRPKNANPIPTASTTIVPQKLNIITR